MHRIVTTVAIAGFPFCFSVLLQAHAETPEQVSAFLLPWLSQNLAQHDLAGISDKDCVVRDKFPGWEGVKLKDCKNTITSAGSALSLMGRTLLAPVEPEQVAAWITSACTKEGTTDVGCAKTTACQVRSQSGGQFAVAGTIIEPTEVDADVVGPTYPDTGVFSGPYPSYGPLKGDQTKADRDSVAAGLECLADNSWKYVVTEVRGASCKHAAKTGDHSCKVFARTALLDYVFSNGVAVVSRDVWYNAKCQLAVQTLTNLVADDSGSRITRLYRPEAAAARIVSTTIPMWERFTGTTVDVSSAKAWTTIVHDQFKAALAAGQNDNRLIDAWVQGGGLKNSPVPTRWPKCP